MNMHDIFNYFRYYMSYGNWSIVLMLCFTNDLYFKVNFIVTKHITCIIIEILFIITIHCLTIENRNYNNYQVVCCSQLVNMNCQVDNQYYHVQKFTYISA